MAIATGLLIIVIVGGLLYFAFGPQGETKLVLDWRLRLTIHDSSTASNNTIPAYIGVEGGIWNSHTLDAFGLPGYAPISTRDTTGTIYIQSTVARIYTFGDFFNIWGQVYNASCVGLGSSGLYCAGREDDSHIKYVDSDGNNLWSPGETVVYDSNMNSLYDAGETIISAPTPTQGKPLRDDPQIYFVDTANYNVWDPGESIVYDVNSNAAYNSNDLGIAYVDTNGNKAWDPEESVVYDNNGDALYQQGELIINGTAPTDNTALRVNLKTRFIDSDGNNLWNSGETVAYDANDNLVYDSGDQLLAGPSPSPGTLLWKEPVIGGAIPRAETSLIRPPPFLSDNEEERCLVGSQGEAWNLSNGKEWTILIWSTLAIGSCHPGNFG